MAEKHVLPISGDCLTFDDDSPAHSRVIARRAGASSPGRRHTDAGGQVAGPSLTFAGTTNQGNTTRQPGPLTPRVYYDLCNVTRRSECRSRLTYNHRPTTQGGGGKTQKEALSMCIRRRIRVCRELRYSL